MPTTSLAPAIGRAWMPATMKDRSRQAGPVRSGEDRLMDDAFDVGEPHVASGVAVGEVLVIEPERVQNGGVQVVHVHWVFDGLVAVIVSLAVGDARLHAAAGEPEGEALVV